VDFKLENVLVSLHSVKPMGLGPLFLRNGELLGHSPIRNVHNREVTLCRCTWVHVFNFFFLCEFALFTIIILLYICCLLLQSNCLRVLIKSWNLWYSMRISNHPVAWKTTFHQFPKYRKLLKCRAPFTKWRHMTYEFAPLYHSSVMSMISF
jgi:hypothetical protein